jgi:hypothetical protein
MGRCAHLRARAIAACLTSTGQAKTQRASCGRWRVHNGLSLGNQLSTSYTQKPHLVERIQ